VAGLEEGQGVKPPELEAHEMPPDTSTSLLPTQAPVTMEE
jgi:hypothetical protein